MTTSTSRPATAASTASCWPGRNAGKPNTSCSASAGSLARANGVGGSGPEPGQRRGDERIGDDGCAHGIDDHSPRSGRHGRLLPGCHEVVAKSAQIRHEARRSRHMGAVMLAPCRSTATASTRSTPGSRMRSRGARRARPSTSPARASGCRTACRWRGWPACTTTARSWSPRRRLPLHRPRRQRVPRLQPGGPERDVRLRAAGGAGGDRRARRRAGSSSCSPSRRRSRPPTCWRSATRCPPGSSRSRPPARTRRRSGSRGTAPGAR